MNVAILVCTYGEQRWADLAAEHAYPSAVRESPANAGVSAQHVHAAGGTLAEVRNSAVARTTSEWVLFVDGDDELGIGYVKAMRAALGRAWPVRKPTREVPNLLLVPAIQYVENGVCVGEPAIPAWDRSLLDLNCACIGTAMPRWLFNRLGGFRDMPIYEDWSLFVRAVRSGAKMVPVPDAVYCATRHAGSRNYGPEAVETYRAVRAEHGPGYDWGDLRRYKLPMP